jgi:hypothetical protein
LVVGSISYNPPLSAIARRIGAETDRYGQIEAALWPCATNRRIWRSNVYLGQAAHCSSTGGQTSTDGCDTGSSSIGTPVDVTGASKPGTLAPVAGSNGVGDLAKEIAYMHANSSFSGVHLVPGTQPFNASLASAILGA